VWGRISPSPLALLNNRGDYLLLFNDLDLARFINLDLGPLLVKNYVAGHQNGFALVIIGWVFDLGLLELLAPIKFGWWELYSP